MNINRNNYEEYFLLYADNELSPVERKVVEIFVQENVDLKEEFLMIQLTLSTPDNEVTLADKSFLLKEEPPFINLNNYEEIFVLYHDNELSVSQKTKVEQFIAEHPEFATEFELIGKSKLTSDLGVVFPNKKELYKKEKSGRVVPLILWRSVAAAIFVGIGLWAGISYMNKQEDRNSIALEEGKPTKSLITTEPKINTEDSQHVAVAPDAQTATISKPDEEQKKSGKENKIAPEEKSNKAFVAKKEEKIQKAPEEKISNMQQPKEQELIASNIPVKKPSDKMEGTKLPISVNEPIQHVDKYDERVQPQTTMENASYAVDNNSNNENYVFYNVKADDFKKTKVGGFLKKVKRIVERTNPITRLLSGEEKQVASN